MYWFNLILYTFFVLPYAIHYMKKYGIAPASVWFAMETLFFYGICFAPAGQTDIAIKLETIYVCACFSFILGLELSKRIRWENVKYNSQQYLNNDPSKPQMYIIWLIIFVGILLCSYLFVSGGVNVFIQSLSNFISSNNEVFNLQRAQFFGVKGQGYIYQFRVVLLPVLCTFILIGLNNKYSKKISIPLFGLMIIFLLGTGQRNAFVFFSLIILLYIYAVKKCFNETIISNTKILIMGCSFVFFLIVLTISNGRVGDEDNLVLGAIWSLVDRILFVNQKTAIFAFSYLDTQPIVWGYDWFMMLMDILPGQSGYVSVDRIVYYYAYGTYKGTGPPCLWGSAWYNFGIFGITLFPFLMGIIYHKCHKNMYIIKNKNKLYLIIYTALCVYMGLWTYGTPMTLFNNGVVTILLLRWLLFRFAKNIKTIKVK